MLLHMATRIQVVVDEAEREAFRAQAQREGVSLSAWLREAGRRRLEAERPRLRLQTAEELEAFFAAIPDTGGREPDWEEHKRVIGESMAQGQSGT
jgi:hypothetical protein